WVVCLLFSSSRRHTRLVSDWSSDVCSSDLADELIARAEKLTPSTSRPRAKGSAGQAFLRERLTRQPRRNRAVSPLRQRADRASRSEERRVGKEGRDGW